MNSTGFFKTPPNILRSYSSNMGGVEVDKNSVFVIWLIYDLIKFFNSLPYTRFKGLKYLISNG